MSDFTAFSTRVGAFLIHGGTLGSGTVTIGGQAMVEDDEEVQLSEFGWDTMKKPYFMKRASLTAEQTAALFPLGSRLGSRNWWIVGAVPVRVAPGIFRVDVALKGWASSKPAKVRVGATAQQQSAENVEVGAEQGYPSGAIMAKVETHENLPSFSVTYLTADADDLTETVGREDTTPAVDVPVPDSVWDYLTTYTFHWPNGWVHMGSDQDRIPGTSPAVAMVTDSFQFIREKTPG